MTEKYQLDRPTTLTCPECGGAVRTEQLTPLMQYRCHIGHVFSSESFLAAQFTALETKLAAAAVALNERAELCRQLIESDGANGGSLERARDEALARAKIIIALLESEWEHSVIAGRGAPNEPEVLYHQP